MSTQIYVYLPAVLKLYYIPKTSDRIDIIGFDEIKSVLFNPTKSDFTAVAAISHRRQAVFHRERFCAKRFHCAAGATIGLALRAPFFFTLTSNLLRADNIRPYDWVRAFLFTLTS